MDDDSVHTASTLVKQAIFATHALTLLTTELGYSPGKSPNAVAENLTRNLPSYLVSIVPMRPERRDVGSMNVEHHANLTLESLGGPAVCPFPPSTVYVMTHRYRTLMAYSANGCESVPRINIFSNPMMSYAGRPQGSATSDNAKRLRETMVRNNIREVLASLPVFWLPNLAPHAGAIKVLCFTATRCNALGIIRKGCSRDPHALSMSFRSFSSLIGCAVHYKAVYEYTSCKQRITNAVHKMPNTSHSVSGVDDVEHVAVAKQVKARSPRSCVRSLGRAGHICAQANS